MSQKRAYKQYSKEFKEEAVALVNDQGYTVPEGDSPKCVAMASRYMVLLPQKRVYDHD
jgi:transposase